MQLGGLNIFNDVSSAVIEVRDLARKLGGKLDVALDTVPRIQQNTDTIITYIPWIIGALGFVGVAIIFHAIKTSKR
ncbi:MAG: hypothetical protein ABI876_00880 [Bacteroidota bacterium]